MAAIFGPGKQSENLLDTELSTSGKRIGVTNYPGIIIHQGQYCAERGVTMGVGQWVSTRSSLMWPLLLLVAGGWTPASGDSAASARIDQPCGVDVPAVPSGWNSSETWAWCQIVDGRVADFDALLGTVKGSGKQTYDRFGDPRRMLGASFLRAVLTRRQLGSAIPPAGVGIQGAVFDGDLDIRDAVLTHPLGIFDSRFPGKVVFNRLRTSTSVSFDGSTFEDELWLDSVRIGGSLNMTNGEFDYVMLKTARIDGDFAMSRSNVKGEVNLNGSTVGGSLFLKCGTFTGVELTNATVGRQLITSGSTFNGEFEGGGLSTGGSLRMTDGSRFGDVILRGARIGDQLILSRSAFGGRLDGESMIVDQDVHMVEYQGRRPYPPSIHQGWR